MGAYLTIEPTFLLVWSLRSFLKCGKAKLMTQIRGKKGFYKLFKLFMSKAISGPQLPLHHSFRYRLGALQVT